MSLRDLADSLGLSPTTVSRALNGYPEVSETTRQRVAEAARAAGYAPNARARSLATGRSMAIGHVIPAASRHEIVNPVFADFLAGAGEVYASRGYEIVLTLTQDGDEEAAYRRLAANGRVDGIIVQAPESGDHRIELLRELNLPFVVHGRASHLDEASYSWLDMDNRRAFAKATRHLTGLGHRKIALLNGMAQMTFAERRAQGFAEALAEVGLTPDPTLLRNERMTEYFGYTAATDMLSLPPNQRPTGFLVSSLLIAYGVQRAAREIGLVLGRDVSLVAHDDGLSYMPNGVEGAPIFTATRSSVRTAGGQAAAMLLDLIHDHDPAPRNHMLEAEFIIGPSTGPAPEPAIDPA